MNNELVADSILLDDLGWKPRLALAMTDMNLTCSSLAQENPPAQFVEINTILVEASQEYRTFTLDFQAAIDAKDVEAIKAAVTHMMNGNAYLQRALDIIKAVNEAETP